jgi:hypothetical protein
MPQPPPHIAWLKDTGRILKTADGKDINVFEFAHQNDPAVLSAWARHFRNHYCADADIDDFRRGHKLSRCDYLRTIKFPDQKGGFGPIVRSGDFGEILVADYVEFMLNYAVPRVRYIDKLNRNESPKGIDIVGFRQINLKQPSNDDELITFEVKCTLTSSSAETLQNALADSGKDVVLRKAESLSAIKQRLKYGPKRDSSLAAVVERFQNSNDHPYKETSGAAAVYSTETYDEDAITCADASSHPNRGNLFLLVIKGEELMKLVHELYRIAADEA